MATAFQPWKPAREHLPSGRLPASMWPRPFSRGNRIEQGGPSRRPSASMWPRPFSRGNIEKPIIRLLAPNRFNVATAFQPWKQQAEPQRSRGVRPASMWPRPFSRGNTVQVGSAVRARQWLQCGHGLSAVETRPPAPARGPAGIASMWPRPFSRGNTPEQWPLVESPRGFNVATAFQPWKRGGGD